jgi:hypothetical protein
MKNKELVKPEGTFPEKTGGRAEEKETGYRAGNT